MTRRVNIIWRPLGILALLTLVVSGCATIPPDALKMTPDTLERRQLQTRRFDGIDEHKILAASAGVLQDLGFNLDESETKLGLIVASKERSAVSASQVTMSVLVALLTGSATAVDKNQKIRVSLVARPAATAADTGPPTSYYVRVTFQRIIWNTNGQVSRVEAIDEPAIYREFFDKLSKSVFLEAQQL